MRRLAPAFPAPLAAAELAERIDRDLRELAAPLRSARQIAVIVEDNSRPTVTGPLVDRLLCGIKRLRGAKDRTDLVVAAGAHYQNLTAAQQFRKLGGEQRPFLFHDATAEAELVQVGTSRAGIPFWVNRRVAEADLRLAVGTVNIHPLAGFSGGAKILLPGVAGLATIEALHALPEGIPGKADCAMRQLMQELLARLPVHFAWQLLSRSDGAIYGYYSGLLAEAHARARTALRAVATVAPPPEPLGWVLAGCRPFHQNLLGSFKALAQLKRLPRPAAVILGNETPDGRGKHHWRNQAAVVTAQREQYARRFSGVKVWLYAPRAAVRDFTELFPAEFQLLKTFPELLEVLESIPPGVPVNLAPYAPVTLFGGSL